MKWKNSAFITTSNFHPYSLFAESDKTFLPQLTLFAQLNTPKLHSFWILKSCRALNIERYEKKFNFKDFKFQVKICWNKQKKLSWRWCYQGLNFQRKISTQSSVVGWKRIRYNECRRVSNETVDINRFVIKFIALDFFLWKILLKSLTISIFRLYFIFPIKYPIKFIDEWFAISEIDIDMQILFG